MPDTPASLPPDRLERIEQNVQRNQKTLDRILFVLEGILEHMPEEEELPSENEAQRTLDGERSGGERDQTQSLDAPAARINLEDVPLG